MLARTSYQRVRPLKPVGTVDFHLPTVASAGTSNRNSPISRAVTQSVFDQSSDFRPDIRIPGIMQFEYDSHFSILMSAPVDVHKRL